MGDIEIRGGKERKGRSKRSREGDERLQHLCGCVTGPELPCWLCIDPFTDPFANKRLTASPECSTHTDMTIIYLNDRCRFSGWFSVSLIAFSTRSLGRKAIHPIYRARFS
jgi:hypothetical protein